MSKIIKMTPEFIDKVIDEFRSSITNSKVSDGRINFTKTLSGINRKAKVYFSEIAWLKMNTLVNEFSSEVAWHGLARRGDDESQDDYYIDDILVYPQEVTGATVTTNQEKYQSWLMDHDDEIFNNIRMQGHSHVNMGVTPSGVDTSLYERILGQLDDSMFYIFMICNKRGDKTIKIYDMKKNIFFDTDDVSVEVLDDGTGIEHFIKSAKQIIQNKVSSYSSSYNAYPVTNNNSIKSDSDKSNACGKNKRRKGKRKSKDNSIDDIGYYGGGQYNSWYGWGD